MKECVKCKASKDEAEYYLNDNKCKECRKAMIRANRRKNIDYYRQYDRDRGNRQPKDYLQKYRAKNPEKYAAHMALGNAVRDGKVEKEPCFMCRSEKVVGHHVDYTKPLSVIWLCQGCHKLIHAYEDKSDEIKQASA